MKFHFFNLFVMVVMAAGFLGSSQVSCQTAPEPPGAAGRPIPVILDTDIGTDIDDTWALALLLASPELDLKLVVTDSQDTRGRAQITARFLQEVGRSDIPVGIGKPLPGDAGAQHAWAADYDLNQYPGTLYEDGVEALIDTILDSPEEITLIVIGPAPNIEEALRRQPTIADRARVVAMSGSVDLGYGGDPEPDPEYNVRAHVPGAAALYAAGWDLLLAPLDTAGLIQLQGERYRRLLESEQPLVKTLIDNYRVWAAGMEAGRFNPELASSTLFDCLAVTLAHDTRFCRIETLNLTVTEDGFTLRDPEGNPVRAALSWIDLEGYESFLVERLLGE